jgi:hypothetical protein
MPDAIKQHFNSLRVDGTLIEYDHREPPEFDWTDWSDLRPPGMKVSNRRNATPKVESPEGKGSIPLNALRWSWAR